jgi:hypothetical protein
MKTHPHIKTLIEFVDEDPSRYYSYMDERRRKQNARAWLVVLAIGVVASCVWLVVRLWK